MNSFIKNTFIFALGATTGALVAIKLLEDHYAALADEEIASAKENLRHKVDELAKKYSTKTWEETAAEKVAEAQIEQIEEEVNNYSKLTRNYKMLEKPALDELAIPYHDEEDNIIEEDEDMMEAESKNNAIKEVENDEPYLITVDEFSDEKADYDKITLWYYQEDDTLADDNEEIVDDYARMIGEDTLGLFDNIHEDRTIYIRNENQSADYEIICLAKSYSVEVLGMEKGADD